jgi:hypothetical protein
LALMEKTMTVEIIDTDAPTASASAVSWAAIIAGGLAALAATLTLFSLGSGLGLAGASPWGNVPQTAAKLGVWAGIWLILVQWISSAFGGYLAGRLRTRWYGTHHHEVFFRDTAHGFLAWALATALVGAIAAWAGGGVVGTAASLAAHQTTTPNLSYYADTLYRSPGGDPAALSAVRAEAQGILGAAAMKGGLSDEDRSYLVASISSRTGVSPAEADRRVSEVQSREHQDADAAKAALDTARKADATLAIVAALSMVVGAFIASVTAVFGGQIRDQHL